MPLLAFLPLQLERMRLTLVVMEAQGMASPLYVAGQPLIIVPLQVPSHAAVFLLIMNQ